MLGRALQARTPPLLVLAERDAHPSLTGESETDETGVHDPHGCRPVLVRRVELAGLPATVRLERPPRGRAPIAPDNAPPFGAPVHAAVAVLARAEADAIGPRSPWRPIAGLDADGGDDRPSYRSQEHQ